MSYLRPGHELEWFKDTSQEYVFLCADEKEGVEDYNSRYSHNPSLCELIGHFILRQTGDAKYADKMVRVLAAKLGCEDKLRKHRLTLKEHMRIAMREQKEAVKLLKKMGLRK